MAENSAFQSRFKMLFNEFRQDRLEKYGKPGTKQEFADLFGATLGAVKGWLNGTGEPNAARLIKISKAVGVSVDWLVGASDERTPVSLTASKGSFAAKIACADSETLAALEEYYAYLQYKKNAEAAGDK